MQNELICPQCEGQYREDNPPRLFVGCGHTFCESCFKKIITQADGNFTMTCPEDGEQVTLKNGDVGNIPKNIALLKILQTKKGNSSFKDPELEMSKIVDTEEANHDDDEARQIVDAIVLSSSVGSQEKICFEKQESTKVEIQQDQSSKSPPLAPAKVEQKCRFHQKPLEVVCIMDLKKICVNCAIFGEHRGHEFKSLQEIENERVAYYSSILDIMDKKQSINDRISSQETCRSIMQILGNKKLKMKNSIVDRFKKLIEAIETKQRESLKTLELIMQKTETKIKNMMKIDPEILQKYDAWEEKSYREIKVLEGDDFEAKLQLLFTDNPDEIDVIEEGARTIELMNKQEENLITEVETTLDNIGVEFNNEILNYIDGFVDIFDEVKKKKLKLRISKLQIQTNLYHSQSQSNLYKVNTTQKREKLNQVGEEPSQPIIKPFMFQQPTLPKKQQKSHENSIHNQQSLLEIEEEKSVKRPQFIKTSEIHTHVVKSPTAEEAAKVLQSPLRRQKNVVSPSSKFTMRSTMPVVSEQMSPRMSKVNKKDEQLQQKLQRPNKKRLAKLKLPQRYDKIIEGLANDQLETLDLTNAELGDNTVVLISEFLVGSKVKAVKFIRNKLSDEGIGRMIPYLRGVITLNLSQNLLTERVLDVIIENRNEMEMLKSVILSQNKINTRNAKAKIDKLKGLDIVVSL